MLLDSALAPSFKLSSLGFFFLLLLLVGDGKGGYEETGASTVAGIHCRDEIDFHIRSHASVMSSLLAEGGYESRCSVMPLLEILRGPELPQTIFRGAGSGFTDTVDTRVEATDSSSSTTGRVMNMMDLVN